MTSYAEQPAVQKVPTLSVHGEGIQVDNPPRDPQAGVKRKPGRPRKYEGDTQARNAAASRAWNHANRPARAAWERRRRSLASRLKRIAAARGMTAEALLDEMERG